MEKRGWKGEEGGEGMEENMAFMTKGKQFFYWKTTYRFYLPYFHYLSSDELDKFR